MSWRVALSLTWKTEGKDDPQIVIADGVADFIDGACGVTFLVCVVLSHI